MSEISFTRFIHATAGPKKVKSLEKANNEGSNSGSSDSSPEDEEGRHDDDANEQSLLAPHDEFPGSEREYEGTVQDEFSSLDADAAEASSAAHASERQLEAAVAKLNDYVQTVQRDIIFGITAGSAEPSVTVVDRASRKLVRQFGGKEAVEMARKLDSQEPLSLFTAQV